MSKPILLALFPLVVAALFSLAFGSVWIPIPQVWAILTGQGGQATFQTILLDIRLPRTLLVLITGMALAGSGATYQGLFRNPLADPYLIGVASGAGLGAVAAMSIRWPYTSMGLFIVPFAAFLTGLLTVFIVYRLAKVGGAVPTTNLILAGVAVSSFATALTSFLRLRSTGEVRRAISWLLGGFSLGGWEAVFALLPYVMVGLGVLLLSSYALNLLQFGDEQAQQLGLDVQRAKIILLAASSLVTAAAVAFSGIIGFVGLIIPHVARIWWGSDYRRLLPLSILLGGSALLFADLLARIVLAPQELPVGIVTALAGAPFFLWVLRRSRNMGGW